VLTHKRHAKDVQKELEFWKPKQISSYSPKPFKVLCSLAIKFVGFRACRVSLGFKVYWVIRA